MISNEITIFYQILMSLLDCTTASKGLPNKERNHMNINEVQRHTQLLSIGYYTSHF